MVVVLILLAGSVLLITGALISGIGFHREAAEGTGYMIAYPTPNIVVKEAGTSVPVCADDSEPANLTAYFETSPLKRSFAYHDSRVWRRGSIEVTLFGGYAEYLERMDSKDTAELLLGFQSGKAGTGASGSSDAAEFTAARIRKIFEERYQDT